MTLSRPSVRGKKAAVVCELLAVVGGKADQRGALRVALAALVDGFDDSPHEVVGMASNGIEAFELYRRFLPDIITMDITMPELNGIEALKKIVEHNKDANVIMVTSLGKPEKVIECLNSGAKNYITKPFDRNKILKTIDEVLNPQNVW